MKSNVYFSVFHVGKKSCGTWGHASFFVVAFVVLERVLWKATRWKKLVLPVETFPDISATLSRRWFQRFCYFHPDPWGDDPIWLIFFRWVGSTNNPLWFAFQHPAIAWPRCFHVANLAQDFLFFCMSLLLKSKGGLLSCGLLWPFWSLIKAYKIQSFSWHKM